MSQSQGLKFGLRLHEAFINRKTKFINPIVFSRHKDRQTGFLYIIRQKYTFLLKESSLNLPGNSSSPFCISAVSFLLFKALK